MYNSLYKLGSIDEQIIFETRLPYTNSFFLLFLPYNFEREFKKTLTA